MRIYVLLLVLYKLFRELIPTEKSRRTNVIKFDSTRGFYFIFFQRQQKRIYIDIIV